MQTDSQWRTHIELAKLQMRQAPLEVWREYSAEAASFDAALADGLEDLPWQG
jgi:hypothetical protein